MAANWLHDVATGKELAERYFADKRQATCAELCALGRELKKRTHSHYLQQSLRCLVGSLEGQPYAW